jgi:hypothetical protein
MAVSAMAVLLVAKLIATSGSVASGAALGSGWSHLFGAAGAAAPDAGRYALMGMAAATAASIHAP